MTWHSMPQCLSCGIATYPLYRWGSYYPRKEAKYCCEQNFARVPKLKAHFPTSLPMSLQNNNNLYVRSSDRVEGHDRRSTPNMELRKYACSSSEPGHETLGGPRVAFEVRICLSGELGGCQCPHPGGGWAQTMRWGSGLCRESAKPICLKRLWGQQVSNGHQNHRLQFNGSKDSWPSRMKTQTSPRLSLRWHFSSVSKSGKSVIFNYRALKWFLTVRRWWG